MRRQAQSGFTLIELMVVVIVMSLLLAIAIPGYRDQVRKTRRNAATACLVEYQQFMERFYTTHLQYHQTRETTPVAVPGPTCGPDVTDFYTVGHDTSVTPASPTATDYALRAVPRVNTDQADDSCGTLTLNRAGVRGQGPGGTLAKCWK